MNLADFTWHALYCRPNKEKATALDLEWLYGLTTIVPAEKRWMPKRPGSKLNREVWVPTMPRYVFAGFSEPPNWQAMRARITGLYGYMSFGEGGPSKLPQSAVEWLVMERDRLVGIVEPKPFHEALRPGDKARVVQGEPFGGRVVTVDAIVSKEAHTFQEMLGGMVLVKIPLGKLERVG